MAKITIEELYRGEKYDIMSAVTAKALQLGIGERTEEGRTWIEMELVRQTVIAIEQMKKNGDCIAEGELGDTVTVYLYCCPIFTLTPSSPPPPCPNPSPPVSAPQPRHPPLGHPKKRPPTFM